MSDYLVSPKQHVVDLMSNGTHRLTCFMLCCDIDKFVFNVDLTDIIKTCHVGLYREGKLRVTIECRSHQRLYGTYRSEIMIRDEETGKRDTKVYIVLPPQRPIQNVRYFLPPESYSLFNKDYQFVTGRHPHLFL